jgi:hypothetical protein
LLKLSSALSVTFLDFYGVEEEDLPAHEREG